MCVWYCSVVGCTELVSVQPGILFLVMAWCSHFEPAHGGVWLASHLVRAGMCLFGVRTSAGSLGTVWCTLCVDWGNVCVCWVSLLAAVVPVRWMFQRQVSYCLFGNSSSSTEILKSNWGKNPDCYMFFSADSAQLNIGCWV